MLRYIDFNKSEFAIYIHSMLYLGEKSMSNTFMYIHVFILLHNIHKKIKGKVSRINRVNSQCQFGPKSTL